MSPINHQISPDMDIKTEKDITPEVAKQLRVGSGLTQRAFWCSVGSNQASGHWFEVGKRKSIPRPIRTLIFLRYVANIDLDVSTIGGAMSMIRIGREISARLEAERAAAAATEAQRIADEAARKAKKFAA
ncbi:hypothetical protein BcepIL02_gp09 [Burkholderia phage BcepIL02]|uniref:RsaL-like HTH domain-containing protein n=1 Tax=Burkholderia phage BcepIL02 TaxID=2886898 RepID=C5IHK1_9CAUD|nr:transcriptional regulator [Burkholderia phage BcepIL02]ACR15002.1 hypothetical protein BcepIL02_gp09 [Burkholderia phage BcepIL02]